LTNPLLLFPDGQQAFIYQAPAAPEAPAFDLGVPAYASDSVATGIEGEHVFLGNGTEGNLEEHASGLFSVYLLDQEPLAAGY
jgi:hypothetical protein